jgi:CheY-like chemotaxis protein
VAATPFPVGVKKGAALRPGRALLSNSTGAARVAERVSSRQPERRGDDSVGGTAGALEGRTVLLVEDDYFIMKALRLRFQQEGAIIVGPAANVPDALALVHSTPRIDAAILDINLQGEMVFPVAEALAGRGVPFVFATGYDPAALPARFASVPHCRKPVDPGLLARLLFG